MYDRISNKYMIANIRQMPLPTNEPEHFEDWRPFMGYTDVDGCVVRNLNLKIYFSLYSGNSKLVLPCNNQPHSLNSWLIRKVMPGICKFHVL